MALPDSPTSLNTHLCQQCRHLFDTPFKIGYPEMIYYENSATKRRSPSKQEQQGPLFKHWPNVYAFADSASNGCHFCRLLWLQLTKDERNQILNKRFEKIQGVSSIRWNLNQRIAKYGMTVGYKLNSGNGFRLLNLHLNSVSGT